MCLLGEKIRIGPEPTGEKDGWGGSQAKETNRNGVNRPMKILTEGPPKTQQKSRKRKGRTKKGAVGQGGEI